MQDTFSQDPLPIVDVRPLTNYCIGHIAGATAIPASQMFEHMHELPQRHVPLQLCGDTATLAEARHFLIGRGFTIAAEMEWSETLLAALRESGQLETGPASRRLWHPSPLLQQFTDTILPQFPAGNRHGIDIACGSGRDLVFMALHRWQMLGVDDSADALHRASSLAGHNNVTVATKLLDLESPDSPLAALPQAGFGLVMVFRYLHRPLLPQLASLLAPGGFLIYQTFLQGCEQFGSPRNPRFLLAPGELAETFHELDILQDEVMTLTDGRPVSAFIARRPD